MPITTFNKFNIDQVNPVANNNNGLKVYDSQAGTQMTNAHELYTPGLEKKLKDKILDDSFSTKTRVAIASVASRPIYAVRGMKGAPDATFHEYLQIGRIPYYIGGPVLAALFNAGANNFNFQNKLAAKKTTKHIAVGVALYYLGSALAKTVINTPVKLFRGVDLNRPYRDVIDSETESSSGILTKKKEYHKVYESIDFTRWDLLLNHDDKNKPINANYDKLAKKYGMDENLNDSDSALKPYIKKTIIMSRAWQYALTALFVTLGIGVAKQEAWGNVLKGSLRNGIKEVALPKSKLNLHQRLVRAKEMLNDNLMNPIEESFKGLWKGNAKPHSKVIGKALILGTALATVIANVKILSATSARNEKTVDVNKK